METDPEWSIVMETDPEWSIVMETDPEWSIVMETGPKWSIVMETDPKWSIVMEYGTGIRWEYYRLVWLGPGQSHLEGPYTQNMQTYCTYSGPLSPGAWDS